MSAGRRLRAAPPRAAVNTPSNGTPPASAPQPGSNGDGGGGGGGGGGGDLAAIRDQVSALTALLAATQQQNSLLQQQLQALSERVGAGPAAPGSSEPPAAAAAPAAPAPAADPPAAAEAPTAAAPAAPAGAAAAADPRPAPAVSARPEQRSATPARSQGPAAPRRDGAAAGKDGSKERRRGGGRRGAADAGAEAPPSSPTAAAAPSAAESVQRLSQLNAQLKQLLAQPPGPVSNATAEEAARLLQESKARAEAWLGAAPRADAAAGERGPAAAARPERRAERRQEPKRPQRARDDAAASPAAAAAAAAAKPAAPAAAEPAAAPVPVPAAEAAVVVPAAAPAPEAQQPAQTEAAAAAAIEEQRAEAAATITADTAPAPPAEAAAEVAVTAQAAAAARAEVAEAEAPASAGVPPSDERASRPQLPGTAGAQPAPAEAEAEAAAPAAAEGEGARPRPARGADPLAARIASCRGLRDVQRLFEQQQARGRLRPRHVAAMVVRLAGTPEGRAAAAAAAAGGGGDADARGAGLVAFAEELLPVLQLGLGLLSADDLADCAISAAAMGLAPRRSWTAALLGASLPRLGQLDARRLAGLAAALPALGALPAEGEAAAGERRGGGGGGGGGAAAAWVKAWERCSRELLQRQQQEREQEQAAPTQPQPQPAEGEAAGERGAAAAAAAAAAATPARASPADVAAIAAAAGLLGFQPGAAWLQTLLSAAEAAADASEAAAAAAPQPPAGEAKGRAAAVLDAPSAAELVVALSQLVSSAQEAAAAASDADKDSADGDGDGAAEGAAASAAAAAAARAAALAPRLARAAAASGAGGLSALAPGVLVRLAVALESLGVQPEPSWVAAFARALGRRVRSLPPRAALDALRALRGWQARAPASEPAAPDAAALAPLLSALLIRLADAPESLSQSEIVFSVCAAANLGLVIAGAPGALPGDGSPAGAAAAASAVHALTTELSAPPHAGAPPRLAGAPPASLAALLRALRALGVAPQGAFLAAAQRELRGRLAEGGLPGLPLPAFCGFAEAVASFGYKLEQELLDGFLEAAQPAFDRMSAADLSRLMTTLGALRQKPRPQLAGALAAAVQRTVAGAGGDAGGSLEQAAACLCALADLGLRREDTQGLRATTAAAAPSPQELASALLAATAPRLPAAPAGTVAAVLSAAGRMGLGAGGGEGGQPAWLTAALEGAEEKVASADDETLTALLEALAALGAPPPPPLAAALVARLETALGRLPAPALAAALTAVQRLGLGGDGQLMGGYLDRALASVGEASPSDAAAVLRALAAGASAAAGPASPQAGARAGPDAAWVSAYTAALQAKLADADAPTLAALFEAAARLGASPGAAWLRDGAAAARALLGSGFADAGRILGAPGWRRPFDLPELVDCLWGLSKMGARGDGVAQLAGMLLGKSSDRLGSEAVSPAQLARCIWALSACGTRLPTKWLNQFASAAAPVVSDWGRAELADAVAALCMQYGMPGADAGAAPAGDGGDGGAAPSAAAPTPRARKAAAAAAATGGGAGAPADAERDRPAQQLLRAIGAALGAAAGDLPAPDVGAAVRLMAELSVAPPAPLLARFSSDAAADWRALSDAALVGAPAALAAVGAAAPDAAWLVGCADELLSRLPRMAAPLRCRAAWALATLGHAPAPDWLRAFEAAALAGEGGGDLSGASPGDAVDLIWALQSLRAAAAAAAAAGAAAEPLPPSALRAVCARCARRAAALGAPRLARLITLLADTAAPSSSQPRAGGGAGDGAVEEPFAVPAGLVEDISKAASAAGCMTALIAAASAPGAGGPVAFAVAAAAIDLRLANAARDELMRRLYAPVAAAANGSSSSAAAAAGDAARALWAGARLGGRWLPPQLTAFEAATVPSLSELDGPEAAMLLQGFALNGHRPSQPWLQAFAAAGLDGRRLAGLPASEALGVLSALRDTAGGDGEAARVPWLRGWAEGLPAGDVLALTPEHTVLLLQLLGAPARGAAEPAAATAKAVDPQLHGTLCLSLSRRLQELSAAQLCAATCALGALRLPPADASLLPALALRAAEKMPAISAAQATGLVRAFAALGLPPGEPLQSKICAKLAEAAGGMDPVEAATVLADALSGLEDPTPALVKALMTGPQLKGPPQLRALVAAPRGAAALVALLGALAGRGLAPPPGWLEGAQMALAGACKRMPLPVVADATRALAALLPLAPPPAAGLEPALAAALVEDTAARMSEAGARAPEGGLPALVAVGGFLADCGFRPREAWQSEFERALASALAPPADPSLRAAELARGLGALAAWGRRGGELPGAALDASRYLLADAPPSALGPLLLALTALGARPGSAWMADWEGVTRTALDAAARAPSDDRAAASAAPRASPSDVAAIVAAAPRAGGDPGPAWLAAAAGAALAAAPRMGDAELAALGSGLHALKFRPSPDWAAAVQRELAARRAAAGGGSGGAGDLASAEAWFAALRVQGA
ncbi:hypothetical protein Rsub_02651 [Raphidocelis subcapitata]|uniref:Uncharacterized protein n=1 Tax=Raphidocelis subcapitata TaxID=307507 RepID=A0A2V0NYE3_9CHLO|nr:hypothetical protein Rsub_02651 [Raphidocelis subcapitata]|eukprot:GBF89947.1 hypothetical protein Rsub_02651 [Raphidocelis subcapitata]